MMHNIVMVVDDDTVVLTLFKKLFSEEFPGVELVTCQNPMHAMELFRAKSPELVIMDIEMPNLNGLEIVKQIKDSRPDTEVIINSAYDYFEYAKQAIVLGVVDYMLKPSSIQSMTDTIQKSLDCINDRKSKSELEASQVRAIIEKELILSIIYNRSIDPIFTEYKRLTGIDDLKGLCAVIVSNAGEADKPKLKDRLAKNKNSIIYQFSTNKWAIVVPNFSEIPSVFIKEQSYFFNSLKHEAGDSMDFSMGPYFSSIKGAYDSFISASDQVKANVGGKDGIGSSLDISSQFVAKIVNKNAGRADGEEFFSALSTEYNGAFELMRMEILDVLFEVKNKFTKNSINWSIINNMLYELIVFEDQYELKEWFLSAVEKLENVIDFKGGLKYSALVSKALDYIDNHYRENISLEAVADRIHVRKEYLSQRFKAEMRINFVNYVNKKRIDAAITLLKHSDKTVGDIALEVGFESQAYFTRIFKKYMGRSPKEIRS